MYEVFIGDAISLGFWIAVICRMALLIAKTGAFGSCAVLSEGFGRNSCAASQIVLALAVDLRWAFVQFHRFASGVASGLKV